MIIHNKNNSSKHHQST